MKNNSWEPLKDFIRIMEDEVLPGIKSCDEKIIENWLEYDDYVIEFARAINRNPLVPPVKVARYLLLMNDKE